jgi:folate-binding protein YgfZ
MEQPSMATSQIAYLPDRVVILVSGPDAEAFLNGIATVQAPAEAGRCRYAALLSPQGKILFDFLLLRAGQDSFLVDAPVSQKEELIKRLIFYRLRSKVEITDRTDDLAVAVGWGEEEISADGAMAFPDPRFAPLGMRAILPLDAAQALTGVPADYHAHRIALGVPEGGRDFDFGEVFPHEADLDQLGGVDFAKGCFVGQEVVSRMQHRGTARKRIVPVEARGDGPIDERAEIVSSAGTPIGELGSVAGRRALALIRLDRAAEAVAAGAGVETHGTPLTIHRPAWARFDWPEALAKSGA